ncbi:cyclin-dependent kinases regulatory subunit-like [Aphis gossypii]|uniref:Cyclin-dependent kinases regulatory subunit n=1 Tax=Aphis gossypii TaxID=80765 RepID=A0A9P0NKY8_APHGO|nr:cyclin-dependent kinases regulatory subunit-like [Aphis gossypii]CAH1733421.1 unnamed protein product [Aphis gossypii]
MSTQQNILFYSRIYEKVDKQDLRFVAISEEFSKTLPKDRTMTEAEWRNLGFELPSGWTHCGKIRPDQPANMVIFGKNKETNNS